MNNSLIKPILFSFGPERAHKIAMSLLDTTSRMPGLSSMVRVTLPETKSVEVAGITFPHPVGLAAGFDKNAAHIDGLAGLGFGHIEIGTVTPLAQDGNPKPRLFRLTKDDALINRMGFNNDGADQILKNLKARKNKNIIIGGNIGKNKVTPNEDAQNDYLRCFETLYDEVDYFVVNVSSPNTPDLRALQEKEPLSQLLGILRQANLKKSTPKPIFLKIAPDLNEAQLEDILDIVLSQSVSGIVATNTTIERNLAHYSASEIESIGAGGLSGRPVQHRSTEVISFLSQKSGGKVPIIGVGGIFTADDAQRKLDAGASLVQVYTGFVYQGMDIVKNILKTLKY